MSTTDEPNIQPESETLPQQQVSEEERAAIERAWKALEEKRARAFSRPYWADSSWDLNRKMREAEMDYERAKD